MGRLSALFKMKIHDLRAPTTIWYKIFIMLVVIATLSLVLLWPEQLSALWFEFLLLVLQFLHTPINFQLWWFIIIEFFVAWLGWFLFPSLEMPWNRARFIYLRSWEEGDNRIFRTTKGYIVINRDIITKRGFRYTVMLPVTVTFEGNVMIAQTEDLEVSRSLMWQRVAEMLIDENKKLRAEIARKEKSLTLEEIIELEKAKSGGEK